MGKGTDDYILLMFQTPEGLWALIIKQLTMLYNYRYCKCKSQYEMSCSVGVGTRPVIFWSFYGVQWVFSSSGSPAVQSAECTAAKPCTDNLPFPL